ncbi:hypothetical protein M752DRAFT_25837 [Aspergillus phoenicis ATCC 13157]|uniref:Uncharacterized protein n=1 Tax=Aspergillus phoenicis ATCC 13157 TaxID=1353007 RepID=A0A370PGL9_ASPPH|nr:hypothetical protein M752DRAFT_25837 [Aspergillus phoenicis ATCC 13157]
MARSPLPELSCHWLGDGCVGRARGVGQKERMEMALEVVALEGFGFIGISSFPPLCLSLVICCLSLEALKDDRRYLAPILDVSMHIHHSSNLLHLFEVVSPDQPPGRFCCRSISILM